MKTDKLVLSLGICVVALVGVMCNENNDYDGDDDDDCYAPDYWEKPNCEGYDYPECGTAVDIAPELYGVTIFVDGTVAAMPVTLTVAQKLEFGLDYAYSTGGYDDGYLFIIKGGVAICLNHDGTAAIPDTLVPTFMHQMCWDTEPGEPCVVPIDPKIFLNGEGAPYFVEISNSCNTRSNRLALAITTTDESTPTVP